MSLQVQADNDVLHLTGRLDASGARDFEAWSNQANSCPCVWDLAGVEFLSSAGIRCLLLLARRLHSNGQRPCLVGARPGVANTIALAGLDKHWEFHPDVAAALAAARRQVAESVSELVLGSGRGSYRIRPASGGGTLTEFRSEPDGRPALVRFDELGVAIGLGAFDAGPGQTPASPGPFFATGQSIFVRTDEGLTDYLSTVTPRQTFAWVQQATRLETDSGERWDTEAPLTWGNLRQDLERRAAAARSRTWAAGISCHLAGRQAVVALVRREGQPAQILALRAEGTQPAGGCGTLAEAAAAAANASGAELTEPDDAAELLAVRVWLLLQPAVREGAGVRLRIEIEEPLSDLWERIIRASFVEEAWVRLRPLTGGYMAATYAAETIDRQGRRTLPTVLKITPLSVALREEAAHRQYVRPFILNNSAVLFGQATCGDYSGLRYNFVGITGADSQLQTLESLYLGDGFPDALAALRQTFTNVLNPWYGQAVVSELNPFASHDPRRLFPHLPEAAQETLGIDPSAPRLPCPPLGRVLPNPYHFLRHRWDPLLPLTVSWATAITHGDLNLNNVLVDERRNIYVIDFSETRIRNVASDFARIEPMGLLQWTRLAGPEDILAVLRVVEASLRGPVWNMPPAPPALTDPSLLKAIALAAELRRLAAGRVASHFDEAAYLLPLLEWTVPIVAFRQMEPERKRVAAWAAGLILGRLLAVMKLPDV